MPEIKCTEEENKTKQSFKDECDINNIMRRYERTGSLPDLIQKQPQYGDFSSVKDYQESLNVILMADRQFAELSAEVRYRFDNDPAKFLDFVSQEKNIPEMEKLGLCNKKLNAELDNQEAKKEEVNSDDKK